MARPLRALGKGWCWFVVIGGAILLVINSGQTTSSDLEFALIFGAVVAAVPFGLAYGTAWLIEGFVAPKAPPND